MLTEKAVRSISMTLVRETERVSEAKEMETRVKAIRAKHAE